MQRKDFEHLTTRRPNYAVNLPEAKEDRAEMLEKLNRAKQLQRSRKNRKFIMLFIVLLVIALGVWQGFSYYQRRQSANQIPADIRQRVNFPIFSPSQLPSEYTFNEDSPKLSGGVLSYELKQASANNSVIVTIQSLPDGFDPKTMFQNNPVPITTVPIGTDYDLSIAEQQRHMIVTSDGSLIFVTSQGHITSETMKAIIAALKLT